jgi:hypothetical protein
MKTRTWKINPDAAKAFASRLPAIDELVDIHLPGEGSRQYPAGVALGVMCIHARTGQEFEAFVRDVQWIRFDGEHFICGTDELQLLGGVAQLFDHAAERGWSVSQADAGNETSNEVKEDPEAELEASSEIAT